MPRLLPFLASLFLAASAGILSAQVSRLADGGGAAIHSDPRSMDFPYPLTGYGHGPVARAFSALASDERFACRVPPGQSVPDD